MTPSRPPRLATWILKHFGCAADNDAVLGDLEERYTPGKVLWYWRQVVVAIVASAFNEVRNQKLRGLSAVLIGWIVLRYVLLPPAAVILGSFAGAFAGDSWQRGEITPIWCAVMAIVLAGTSLTGVLSGWLVAFLHDRRRVSVLLHATTVLIIWTSITPQGEGIGRLLFWFNITGITTGILIGGLFMTRLPNPEAEKA